MSSLKRGPDLQWGRREVLGAHILYPVENQVLVPFKHCPFSPLKNAFKNEHAFLSK